jgi:hypothetical protein
MGVGALLARLKFVPCFRDFPPVAAVALRVDFPYKPRLVASRGNRVRTTLPEKWNFLECESPRMNCSRHFAKYVCKVREKWGTWFFATYKNWTYFSVSIIIFYLGPGVRAIRQGEKKIKQTEDITDRLLSNHSEKHQITRRKIVDLESVRVVFMPHLRHSSHFIRTVRWSNFDRLDPKMGVFLQSTDATPCLHALKWKLTPKTPLRTPCPWPT